MNISIRSYSQNTPNANCMELTIGELVLWFSYKTVVGYRYKGRRVVSENVWGSTTGKHLNWIDGGKSRRADRLPYPEFEEKLSSILVELGLEERSAQ